MHESFTDKARHWFEEQPKSRLIFATIIVLGLLYVILGFGYGPEYHKQVEEEKVIARYMCENAYEWVMADPERLKMGKSDIKNMPINGRKFTLEYVKYPEVLFLESGLRNINNTQTAEDIYCFFKDPRDSTAKYYYNYATGTWVDKVRFHR